MAAPSFWLYFLDIESTWGSGFSVLSGGNQESNQGLYLLIAKYTLVAVCPTVCFGQYIVEYYLEVTGFCMSYLQLDLR